MKSSGYDHLLLKEEDKNKNSYQLAVKKSKAFFYDSQQNYYCGRALPQLAIFFLYILGLCLFMIAITTSMFFIFTEFVTNEDKPLLDGTSSILNDAPALSFRPLVDFKSALIRYRISDPSTYMMYVQSLRAFVDLYEDPESTAEESYASCEDGVRTPDDPKKPCRFNLKWLYMCSKQYNFGYDRGKPCVILKMNNVFNWVPKITNTSLTRDILVECYGQNEEDIDNFSGLSYYPNVTINGKTYGYFNHLYFPYLVQYGYRQPLVGVLFETPKRNIILMIACKVVNLASSSDPITFEILVD